MWRALRRNLRSSHKACFEASKKPSKLQHANDLQASRLGRCASRHAS